MHPSTTASHADHSHSFYFYPTDRSSIHVDRLSRVLNQIKPLTLPYHDKENRIIQLWKSHKNDLLGIVMCPAGKMRIILKEKIHHFLSRKTDQGALISQLESVPLKRWDIVFDEATASLVLWPHLEGGGKNKWRDSDLPIWRGKSPGKPYFINLTRTELIAELKRRGYRLHSTNGRNPAIGQGVYIHHKDKFQIHIDPAKGNEPDHIDATFTKEGLEGLLKKNKRP